MPDIGIIEIVVGITLYWFLNFHRKRPIALSEPNPKNIEVRRIMEDISSTGGVDPQQFSRLRTLVRDRGLNFIPTDLQDKLRTMAEMSLVIQENPIEKDRREIPPPPAPNSRPAISLVQTRFVRNTEMLKGPTENGTANVFITTSS